MSTSDIYLVLTTYNRLTHSPKWREVKFDFHTAELIKALLDESNKDGHRGLQDSSLS